MPKSLTTTDISQKTTEKSPLKTDHDFIEKLGQKTEMQAHIRQDLIRQKSVEKVKSII